MRFPTISVKWLFVVSATVNVEIGGQEGTHAGWLERCSRKYQRPSTQHGGWHCSEPGPCPRANVVAWPGIEVGQLAADATNRFLRAADEMLPALDGALGESAELPLPSASSSAGRRRRRRDTTSAKGNHSLDAFTFHKQNLTVCCGTSLWLSRQCSLGRPISLFISITILFSLLY